MNIVGNALDSLSDKSKGVAAFRFAQILGPGHRIVTILCDSGTRHLSKFWARAGNISGELDVNLADIIDAASSD